MFSDSAIRQASYMTAQKLSQNGQIRGGGVDMKVGKDGQLRIDYLGSSNVGNYSSDQWDHAILTAMELATTGNLMVEGGKAFTTEDYQNQQETYLKSGAHIHRVHDFGHLSGNATRGRNY